LGEGATATARFTLTPRIPSATRRPGRQWRVLVRRGGALVRDAWLVAGTTLLLMLLMEAIYRTQDFLGRAGAGLTHSARAHVPYPYADSSWFPEYQRERQASTILVWSPYVYFRRPPFQGTYINVDSARHRRTVQPRPGDARTRAIFFFGGSTMWGTGQRDAYTIPSVAARGLADAGIHDVAVTNYGEAGYVFAQDLLTLMLALRAGAKPVVVVFYDGINDVVAAIQNDGGGIPQNEAVRAHEFALGRAVFNPQLSLRAEARAAAAFTEVAAGRSAFMQWLTRLVRRGRQAPPSADSLAVDIVRTYAATAQIAEALGTAYGFRVLYVWQPAFQVTAKPLSPFERDIAARAANDDSTFWQLRAAIHRRVAQRLDSVMARIVPGRFLDLTGLFAADTATEFLDDIGHNTEHAVGGIVAAMLPKIEEELASSPPHKWSQ
jgi:lysophospholipase L1-like esterase